MDQSVDFHNNMMMAPNGEAGVTEYIQRDTSILDVSGMEHDDVSQPNLP